MSGFSLGSAPLDLIRPVTTAPTSGVATGDEAQKRAAIGKASQDFESSFLSNMLGQMFEGLQTDGPFGGGQGEAMFRSMMTDEYSKQIVAQGGFGLAASVQRELLKTQEIAH